MTPALVCIMLIAFVPYAGAVARVSRLDWRRARWWIIWLAVAARAGMLAMPVTLSDDLYRYWWEGRVQLAAENPYRYGPDAPELAGLRDANWERVGHKEVPSAYPPLLLGVFRAGAWVGRSPEVFRIIFTAFDLATGWLLVRLLRARGRSECLALVWLLNPLVILEFAGNGHEMSLAVGCFVAGLWALTAGRAGWAGVAFAAAAMAHVLAWPVIVAVLAAERMRSWRFWWAFAAAAAACSWPVVMAGSGAALGLVNFGARWRFNGALFEILAWLAPSTYVQTFGGVWLAERHAKAIAAGILAAVFAWTVWRRYDATRAALAVCGTVLLLSPTVHPWYVTWLVALACVEFRPAWVVWSGTVLLSYAGVSTWWEYAPVFALLIWAALPSSIKARWSQQKL